MPNLIEAPNQERAAEDEFQALPVPKPTKLPHEPGSWRIVRLLIALPLLAVSIAALFPFAVLPVSTQAVVNARLSRVRSPMEGDLGTVTLETGDLVSVNQLLTTVSIPHSILRTEAIGDSRSRADTEQEDSRVGAALLAAEMEKTRYDKMYGEFLQHTADDLDAQIHEAQLLVESSQRKAKAATDEVERDRQALQEHLISKSTVDQAAEKADEAEREVETNQATVRRLQKQLSDAKAGFILDTSSAPPFLAARDQAATDVDRLREEKAALDRRLSGKGPAEESMPNSIPGSRTRVVSPVSGTIWSRSVATGQTVQEGDDLFRIADANSIHVEVWLDRRYGPQLSIGDTALVYLSGLGKELSGRVTSFEGANRRLMEEEVNAIDLQPVHPDQYHVSIELAPQDRQSIYIGQAAKVLFPGSKHPLRARAYFWLTRL